MEDAYLVNMLRDHRKAVKKTKSPETRKKVFGEGSPSNLSAWTGPSIPTGQAALDQLLKDDRQKREKELEKNKWFHANTSRNLAEIKLKDGKFYTGLSRCLLHKL